ncbi:MAG TPA: TetR/AcrR family transcriptional regulator [Magnetospirillaceae bacterium]|nr:TetR/AcrR family transcriptional regulator [Magnetospirillaceae bacterium]
MGRPSREDAERIGEDILATATEMFLAQGYGATSIEAIAQRLGIAKRTFYARFKDKAALFEAVVHHIVDRLKPPDMAHLFQGGTLEEILLRVGQLALDAAISPNALALQSLVLTESSRFPELAGIALGEGTRQQAVEALAHLMADRLPPDEARFAAAQFLQMAISLPQHSALGIAPKMSKEDHRLWVRRTVSLFLDGCLHWGK